MQFRVNEVTQCAGGNHITVQTDVGDIKVPLSELQQEPSASFLERTAEILVRLRAAVKEANATTFVTMRLALRNKTFQV